MFDRKIFFDAVRFDPFGGSITQDQVEGMNVIPDTWGQAPPSDDLRWLAYALATTSQASVRSLVGSSLSLGAHQSERVLCAEHMAMQVGDPLAPCRGDVQVGNCFLQVGRDTVPVEVGITLDQVCRRGVAELTVEANLL